LSMLIKRRYLVDPLVALVKVLIVFTGVFTGISFLLVYRLENEGHHNLGHHLVQSELQASVSDTWPYPFVHILNTRFQQQQANLTSLGKARLILFETFCLNSILGQTVLHGENRTPFLWIIKVDPELPEDLLSDLIALVGPYDFIYVAASNVNFGVGQREGGWRGGEAGSDVIASKLYTGNVTLLLQAHSARATRAVLETRVDADDGLNVEYIKILQAQASKKLKWTSNQSESHRQKWIYWCALRHIDWSPTPPVDGVNQHNELGVFVPNKSPHLCISAGITLGVSIGVEENQVPRFGHYELFQKLRGAREKVNCGGGIETKCLQMVAKPFLGAIRSRTPTSAGMRGILLDEETFEKRLNASIGINRTVLKVELWNSFHCRLDQVVRADLYLKDHMVDIVVDNLRGQCTKGHSCKESTKEVLQNLLLNHSRSSQLQDPLENVLRL
jgi:hypothetical protein